MHANTYMHMLHMHISIMFIMAVAFAFTMRSPFCSIFGYYSAGAVSCQALFQIWKGRAGESGCDSAGVVLYLSNTELG